MTSARREAQRKMHMIEKVYQILFGDPLAENLMFLENALSCRRSFALAHRVTDISELVSYLAGAGNFVDTASYPAPDLVLLDLNLSGRGSGFEVLKWIQGQPTRNYRVVVFSTGVDDLQCEQAYALEADGFVSKPRSAAEMIDVLVRIEGWLRNSVVEDDPLEFCVA
jgi:DNA-binding NarL/FixJ family response regulator